MRKSAINTTRQVQYAILLLPGMIIFSLGTILPIVLSFWYSLTSWNGFTRELPWAGLNGYIKIAGDTYARDAWIFTIQFTIWNTIIQNVIALLFAVIIDGGIKARNFYRTVLFIPCLISPVVAGYVWAHMYSDVLPSLSELLRLNLDLRLFGKSDTVLLGILIVNNWQWIGYWMLIYLAALQSIPKELYEAANMDGASSFTQFRAITIPMLAPAFTICIVGITVGSLKIYDLLVTATSGGPGRASTSIIYYIYNVSVSGREYGYGSALSVTLILALMIIALIQLSVLRKREIQF